MSTLKSRLAMVLFLAVACLVIFPGKTLAQTTTQQPVPPDCVITFSFTADGAGTQNTAAYSNRYNGCMTWTITYQGTGSGSITGLTFQSAAGAVTAGSFGTYGGTVITGINPNTSSTGAVSTFSNGTTSIPWVRVLLTEGTFVGTINGTLYGYKTGYARSGGGGGSGCVPSGSAGQVLIDDGAGACASSAGVTISGGTTVKATGGYSAGATPPALTLGTGGGTAWQEGTIPATCKTASVVCLYADSAQHGVLASFNNGNYLPLPQGPASTTSGNGACWNATNGGLLKDCGGVPVPTTRTISTTSPLGGGGDLSADRTFTCSTCTTNGSALTANLPVIGAGSNAVAVGTRSGNTTQYVTTTGTQTNGRCVEIDSNGNHIAAAAACGTGGTGCTTSGSANGVLVDDGAGGCSTSAVTIDPTAGKAGAINMPQGTACTPAANSVCRYAPASIGTAYGVVEPSSVGVTGIVHSTVSGAVRTDVAPSLIVNADITNATIDLTTKVTGVLPTANIAVALANQTSLRGNSMAAAAGDATIGQVIAHGAKALATSAISSGACSSAQTDTATGTATTDTVIATFNADPTSTTGYAPSANGGLHIVSYPTADTVNFKVCNDTASSITPGAATLNWKVIR